jgi:hypothetical protein
MGKQGVGEQVFELTLKFDPFGRRALDGVADRQGRTLEEVLADALDHLEASKQRRRPAATPPRFLARRADAELSLGLATDASGVERLRSVAGSRQVPVERLIEHALLLYLADGDS